MGYVSFREGSLLPFSLRQIILFRGCLMHFTHLHLSMTDLGFMLQSLTSKIHLQKLTLKLEDGPIEEELPFQKHDFQVPCRF